VDIAEFLTAQYDEDEALALRWMGDGYDWREWQIVGSRKLTYGNGVSEIVTAIDVTNQPAVWAELIYVKSDIDDMSDHLVRHSPARVLADIAAKRQLLDEIEAITIRRTDGEDPDALDRPAGRMLRVLAAPYADRPGYDDAWKIDDLSP
jgi:hypothetical protein